MTDEIQDATHLKLPPFGREVTVVALHHDKVGVIPGKVYKGYYVAFPLDEYGGRTHINLITDDRESALELTQHPDHGFYGTPGKAYEYPFVYGENGMMYLHTERAVVHTTDFDHIKEVTSEVEAARADNRVRAKALNRMTPRERELLGV